MTEGMSAIAVEKTSRLLIFLEAVATHEFLQNRVCLHGGTALNLFIFRTPRLSLDADLNYIGNADREVMLRERPLVDRALAEVAQSLGLRVETGPDQHAGRTYKMVYSSQITGHRDFIKVDMDYLNRATLIPPEFREPTWGEKTGIGVLTNAPIEVAGGKIMALLGRVVPRDLFDITLLAKNREIYSTGDKALDRKILLYYITMSDPFPRQLMIRERFSGTGKQFEENLLPLLLNNTKPQLADMIDIAEEFIQEIVQPRTNDEAGYLDRMMQADYQPDMLFKDYPGVLQAALSNPRMQWKLQNQRKVSTQHTH
ncbi:MAG: nucleotidyl transferase AbiEii/AbiGii toxin family protein [Coriobacteriales bacterium]|jgi:predicted nucleotidyltransferase component of viral defense system|nr:nucleotidyl transferase AbiEii/AbiGii toxin family protein [Coriobacteriales bacterium]